VRVVSDTHIAKVLREGAPGGAGEEDIVVDYQKTTKRHPPTLSRPRPSPMQILSDHMRQIVAPVIVGKLTRIAFARPGVRRSGCVENAVFDGLLLAFVPLMHRVLVVDAERNARHALKELLEDEGYTVAMCARASEALAAADELHPEVALVDEKQRGELVRELPKRGCAVILMSVLGGSAGRLRKPINISELFAAVAAAVSRPVAARHA
jgi:hypothetical protein